MVEILLDGYRVTCDAPRHKGHKVMRVTLVPLLALGGIIEREGWKSNTAGDKHYCPVCQHDYADPTR